MSRSAGVSRSIISLVLNGRASTVRISLKTRERVLSAAAELGYTPNHAARSLRQRSTKIITFVLPSLENPYFLEIVSAAQAEAGARRILRHDNPVAQRTQRVSNCAFVAGCPLMTALSWLVTTIAPHRSCRRLQHVAWPWSSSRNPVLRPGSIASASILKRGDIWLPGIFLALVTDESLIPRRRCGRRVRAATGSNGHRRAFVGGRSAF